MSKYGKVTIVLTAAGTQTFANVVNALNRDKYHIVATDASDQAYGLYLADTHYIVPRAKEAGYIDSLTEICKKESASILLPLYSIELGVIAENKKRFHEMGVVVPISDPAAIEIADNKWKTYKFFKKLGIPVPESYENINDVPTSAYPLVVKPRISSGSRNTFIVESEEEFKAVVDRVDYPIIQKQCSGMEFTVDVLADMNSEPLVVAPRKRLKTVDGKSTNSETFTNKNILEYTRSVIANLPLKGPANIQGFVDESGTVEFIEINPRFAAGGLPLTIAAGANTPEMLLEIAQGRQPASQKAKNGVVMLRYMTEIFLYKEKISEQG